MSNVETTPPTEAPGSGVPKRIAQVIALLAVGALLGLLIWKVATRDAGDSKSEIKARLVGEFGQAVLAEPSKRGFNLLAWVLPLIGIVLAAIVLGGLAYTWSRSRATGGGGPGGAAGAGLDADTERKLDEELARFED